MTSVTFLGKTFFGSKSEATKTAQGTCRKQKVSSPLGASTTAPCAVSSWVCAATRRMPQTPSRRLGNLNVLCVGVCLGLGLCLCFLFVGVFVLEGVIFTLVSRENNKERLVLGCPLIFHSYPTWSSSLYGQCASKSFCGRKSKVPLFVDACLLGVVVDRHFMLGRFGGLVV